LELSVERAGVHTILVRCVNYEKKQCLRVFHEGQAVFEQDIPFSPTNADVLILTLTVKLKAGKNLIDLFPSHWTSNSDSKLRCALLILGIYHYLDADAGAGPWSESHANKQAA
jgi:hypothetical protein